jgi:hypothetical protein
MRSSRSSVGKVASDSKADACKGWISVKLYDLPDFPLKKSGIEKIR